MMPSDNPRYKSRLTPRAAERTATRRGLLIAVLLVASSVLITAQSARQLPRFYPDDPIAVDDDSVLNAGKVDDLELSETWDFLTNSFRGTPAAPGRAVNVNTLDEVPDSSWFVNRIGVRDLSRDELARGPNKFATFDIDPGSWTVTRGKGPGGFHPGFRAVHAADPEQVYQIEVDPPDHPQMATGAEVIGTLIYHALGYHVIDVYVARIDPRRIKISETATTRDAAGERRFTQADLDAIWRVAARDKDGMVYVSASRFEEGEDLGQWEYHGTRGDDPNDIHPHEHRRELRANRVVAAWLAHDDSRAVNTQLMRVEENGRNFLRHYMYDFGALLGSATRFAEPVTNNHEHFIEGTRSVTWLASLGFVVPPHLRVDRPEMPPSVGLYESVSFVPEAWKPNYPNPAFNNMQLDDAFWGARLVARFSDEAIRTIVARAGYDDPAATEYLSRTLIERRDTIARTWLTAVNPVVHPRLSADGTLAVDNAAVQAGVATAGTMSVAWARFDNAAGTATPVTSEGATPATLPASLRDAEYVQATITQQHPEYPAWQQPVQVYFRRDGSGWKAVGLYRTLPNEERRTKD